MTRVLLVFLAALLLPAFPAAAQEKCVKRELRGGGYLCENKPTGRNRDRDDDRDDHKDRDRKERRDRDNDREEKERRAERDRDDRHRHERHRDNDRYERDDGGYDDFNSGGYRDDWYEDEDDYDDYY